MGEVDAIGDAVSGALLSRAVEPGAGAADGHTHETDCLNCGAALSGPYCSNCGQHAHVHRTLSAFFHDLLHGVLHFEGKIWNTLPLLAIRPGELTRRYIEGQRARFVSPMALFLFSVFLLFATVSLVGGSGVHLNTLDGPDIETQLRADRANLHKLQAQRAAAIGRKEPTDTIDDEIESVNSEISALESLGRGDFGEATVETPQHLPPWASEIVQHARHNPELLAYKIKTNAYKFGWALIPISVPLVWLLFPFSRRFKLYDHTVFVTYSLCFVTMLGVLWLIVGALGVENVAGLLALAVPLHMFLQLRGAYELSFWAALWRTLFLVVFALLAISAFSVLLVAMGLFD